MFSPEEPRRQRTDFAAATEKTQLVFVSQRGYAKVSFNSKFQVFRSELHSFITDVFVSYTFHDNCVMHSNFK